jgi:ankyrin repeat protein
VALIVVAFTGTVAAQQQTNQPLSVSVSVAGDVNRATPDGTTPLHVAVRAGDMPRVQALLHAGANVNAATRYANVTPITLAAINGDAAMIDVLLKAGADPNTANGEGETVLMRAARTGNPQAVKALIDHGADVNAHEGWFQQTALMWAAAQNHGDAARALIMAGADMNARAIVPDIPIPTDNAGGLPSQAANGQTPLLYAARNGAIDAIRALADSGANLDLADRNGISPLSYALLNGHYDAAAVLLDKGADPNVVDITGRGPLFVAVDMHSLENRFNRPDPKLDNMLTPLELVKRLIDKGAHIDQKLTAPPIRPKTNAGINPNLIAGSTPLLRAATTSDVELLRLLVARGADPTVTNKDGTNALMMAAGLNWRLPFSRGTQDEAVESVRFLLDLGLDVNAVNVAGDTALHGAASRTEDQDANKLIEFLVANGANLYTKNKKGRLPRDDAGTGEKASANGEGEQRGINHRSLALLEKLMRENPERPSAGQ